MTTADKPVTTPARLDPLRFGYLNYPQFSGPNGAPTKPVGLSVDFVNMVGRQLGINRLYAVECKWSNFKQKLNNRVVDVIVDPILPTSNRNTLEIVPYAKVKCFVLLYHRAIARHVEDKVTQLKEVIATRLLGKPGPRTHGAFNANQNPVAVALADVPPVGTAFIVGAGLYERDFLENYSIPYEEFRYNGDVVREIVKALNNVNVVVITDEPLALATLRVMEADGVYDVDKADLFEASQAHGPEAYRAIENILDPLNYQCAGLAVRARSSVLLPLASLNLRELFRRLCDEKQQVPKNLGIRFIEDDDKVPPVLDHIQFTIPFYGRLDRPLWISLPPSNTEQIASKADDRSAYPESQLNGLVSLFATLLNAARELQTANDSPDFQLKTIDLWAQFRELNTFCGINASCDELIAVLQLLPATDAGVLTPDRLASVIDAFTWLHEVTSVTDALLDRVEDRLEAAGFDLECPMGFLQGDE